MKYLFKYLLIILSLCLVTGCQNNTTKNKDGSFETVDPNNEIMDDNTYDKVLLGYSRVTLTFAIDKDGRLNITSKDLYSEQMYEDEAEDKIYEDILETLKTEPGFEKATYKKIKDIINGTTYYGYDVANIDNNGPEVLKVTKDHGRIKAVIDCAPDTSNLQDDDIKELYAKLKKDAKERKEAGSIVDYIFKMPYPSKTNYGQLSKNKKTITVDMLDVMMHKLGQTITISCQDPQYTGFSKGKYIAYTNKTLKLKTYHLNGVKFKSSNKKIATVNANGIVKGIKKGTVTITATKKGKKYTCKVTVRKPSLKLNKSKLTIKKKKKAKIKAVAKPAAKITYTSSNKKIATVTSKGTVKGIKKGHTTIKVKANGITKKVKIIIK